MPCTRPQKTAYATLFDNMFPNTSISLRRGFSAEAWAQRGRSAELAFPPKRRHVLITQNPPGTNASPYFELGLNFSVHLDLFATPLFASS
ncbi:hypothetical protein LshimejAT787_1104560 [Lyophyllum shimeji]|uniref:Uncharacterized protein n=1 Tax=Lyophyllum shimeji TaxID=47721 RepID=A0A9P3PVI8_LYOSH|nr:hypothetical protein LshimejAT787_1104560 [Lyophyllum shimeji]